MSAEVSKIEELAPSSGKFRCWAESLILGLGIPSAIWASSKLISTSIPAAVHGSPEQRFLFWISGGVIVEWLFVVVLWFVLRHRGLSFKNLGVWRLGTWPAWVMALLFASLSIATFRRKITHCSQYLWTFGCSALLKCSFLFCCCV